MFDFCLYHDECIDGACSAWLAIHHNPDIKCIPVRYNQPPPPEVMHSGKSILIADFSYDASTLLWLAGGNRRVVVLDHHKTAREALADVVWHPDRAGNPALAGPRDSHGLYVQFDTERAGCQLTRDYLFGIDRLFGTGEIARLKLVDYIGNWDRWEHDALPHTRAIHMLTTMLPLGINATTKAAWYELAERVNNDFDRAVLAGQALAHTRDALVNSVASKAVMHTVWSEMIPAVECPRDMRTEVGQALLNLHPMAPFVGTYTRQDGKAVWSLRSEDRRMDVSAIAQRLGGGGHRNAAGFVR